MFVVGFQGVDGAQLISLANQEGEFSEQPTAIRVAVSEFLNSSSRDHVVGVNFLSQTAFYDESNGIAAGRGAAYSFLKHQSPMWHDDFAELFSPS